MHACACVHPGVNWPFLTITQSCFALLSPYPLAAAAAPVCVQQRRHHQSVRAVQRSPGQHPALPSGHQLLRPEPSRQVRASRGLRHRRRCGGAERSLQGWPAIKLECALLAINTQRPWHQPLLLAPQLLPTGRSTAAGLVGSAALVHHRPTCLACCCPTAPPCYFSSPPAGTWCAWETTGTRICTSPRLLATDRRPCSPRRGMPACAAPGAPLAASLRLPSRMAPLACGTTAAELW